LIEESTEKESMKLGSKETPGARREVTGYLWYNGSASYRAGDEVEETRMKVSERMKIRSNGRRTREFPECRPETR